MTPQALCHRPARRTWCAATATATACAAAALCSSPVFAAPYYWSYAPACSALDFTSTCWAASPGGPGGNAAPPSGAEVHIQQSGAVSLPVAFANVATGRDMTLGALTIDGTGSASAALTIARKQLQTSYTTVGATGNGRIDLSGGSHVVNGDLIIGNEIGARGVYNNTGGTLSSASAAIGNQAGTNGSMQLTGSNARWVDSTRAIVAVAGSGNLSIGGGATAGFAKLETSVGVGTQSSVTVVGAGSQLTASNFVIVGDVGSSSWQVLSGASVQTGTAVIGYRPGGNGTVAIDGAGTRWTNFGDFNLGNQGTASVSVSNGALLSSQQVTVNAGSTLRLNGGTIETLQFNRLAGSVFDWTTGTLRMKSTGNGSSLGSNGLDRALTLGAGQVLVADERLVVGSGSVLSLDSGAVKTPWLRLDGGSIVGSGLSSVNMSDVALLNGHGSVAAALRGGGAGSIIAASAGNLLLGRLDLAGAIAYDGVLNIGNSQVVLLDSIRAQLGLLTTLVSGTLASVNGARIGAGQQLISTGSATVQGGFTNDGEVRANSNRLTFVNDVDGVGSFSGDVLFRARYTPGFGLARVGFDGGSASFDTHSMLTLQIIGHPDSGLYDQLTGIGALRFDGRLVLDFNGSAALTDGSRYALLEFASFAGSLAADRVDVIGFDRGRLDLSRLGIDGSVTVTAVPEPATWALWMAGAGVAGAVARRRRRLQPTTGQAPG